MAEDPTVAPFWNRRYDASRTPWDHRGVPAALTRHLAAFPGRGSRVLVPGCGSGYEITALAAAGYEVTAIDFSPPAVERARRIVGPVLADRVWLGDFFRHPLPEASFDLIYERTFLCALPVDCWPAIAARCAALLRPGGILAGVYFFGDKEDGPPFGLAPGEAGRLFDAHFTPHTDQPIPAAESIPLFAGRERWCEWRRRE
jgi:SAM-dependent methyltransferase